MADVLHSNIRAGDLVARLGGDEFVVLLRGCDARAATTVAETLRAEVEARVEGVTISLGVATAPEGRRVSAAQMVRASDAALCAAKESGRNVVSMGDAGEDG